MRRALSLGGAMMLLAACGDAPPPPPVNAPTAVKVSAAPLRDLAVFIEHSAPASVLARNETTVAAEVAAPVRAVTAEVGARVAAGAVLVRLDPTDAALAVARADAALAQATARLTQARATQARAASLQQQQFISAEALSQRQTEVAVAAADVAAAQAARDTARRAVDKHVVRAPFAGVVQKRQAQVGMLAAPGAALVTLVEAAEPELSAAVQGKDVASLTAAPTVRFESTAGAQEVRLQRVAAVVERGARTQEARLAAAPGAAGLTVGSEGRLVWRGVVPHVPANLVVRRNGRYGVFVLEQTQARFVALDDAQEGRPAPATGLAPDTPVVIDGRFALQDGADVVR